MGYRFDPIVCEIELDSDIKSFIVSISCSSNGIDLYCEDLFTDTEKVKIMDNNGNYLVFIDVDNKLHKSLINCCQGSELGCIGFYKFVENDCSCDENNSDFDGDEIDRDYRAEEVQDFLEELDEKVEELLDTIEEYVDKVLSCSGCKNSIANILLEMYGAAETDGFDNCKEYIKNKLK